MTNWYHQDESLAEKLDKAWICYSNGAQDLQARRSAQDFLVHVLDIQDTNNLNFQLIQRMQERETMKALDPDYIPGVTIPAALSEKAATEFLHVNDDDKINDQRDGIQFFDKQQRAKYRVLIHGGKFYQSGRLFDTSDYLCHKKKKFAGFTLNASGELSVFNHNEDKICHSSMNAGKPVMSAGELVIEEGVLRKITTYSGHYQPSIFTIYRTLAYLASKGVDISQAEVFTHKMPRGIGLQDEQIKRRLVANVSDDENDPFSDDPDPRPDDAIVRDFYCEYYSFSAKHFLDNLKSQLEKACIGLQADIKTYNLMSFEQFLYLLKDIFIRSSLTEDRKNLADEANTNIGQLLNSSSEDFDSNKTLVHQGITLLTGLIERNNALSLKNGKAINSGRLHDRLINCLNGLRFTLAFKPCYEEDSSLTSAMKACY